MNSDKIIEIAVNALNNKKARNINAIHVGELTVVAEYFIMATATSQSHIKALSEEIEEKLEEAGFKADHIEGKATGWLLLQYMGVIIHIFTADTREYYNLDRMWADGDILDLDSILDNVREVD